MSWYRAVVRMVFAVAFLGGALVHLYFGLFSPHSYAPFADTVLWPWLAELWRGFIMANIGWLSLLTAVFELAVSLGLFAVGAHEGRQSWRRWGSSPSSWSWATPGRRTAGGRTSSRTAPAPWSWRPRWRRSCGRRTGRAAPRRRASPPRM